MRESLVACMLLCACVFAYSESHTGNGPQSHSGPRNPQQISADSNGTSEKHPVFVQIVPTKPTAEENADKGEARKEQDDHFKIEHDMLRETTRMADRTRDLAVFTALLFVFTAGLFVIALRQMDDSRRAISAAVRSADLAEDALRLNRDTANRQLRAYVLAQPKKSPPNSPPQALAIDEAGNAKITLRLKNHGQTPAVLTFTYLELRVEPQAATEIAWVDGESTYSMTLGPSASVDQWHSIHLPPHARAAIRAGTHALYARSLIRYVDVFGDNHTSETVFFSSGDHIDTGTIYVWPHRGTAT